MGFAVLHIQKPKGNDSRTSAHIERTIQPGNADPSRKHLNKEFISFADGVENRTQAIQHRIEHAGITRKIRENQVRALQIMLSGTHENMQHIQASGRLDEWCKDNIEWLQNTFGKENLVSAVLHMDEKTPHIHATVIPIVTGERRKAETENKNGKKKYRKKPKDNIRLCADDIMTRDNLKLFQDTYAEKMEKYGLGRGIKGSEARHVSTAEHYRELYMQSEELKETIEYKEEQKQEVNADIRDLYDRKDEAREKFLNMHEYTQQKETEISNLETRIKQLKQDYEPYKAQDDINLLFSLFPHLSEHLRIAQLCKGVGLAIDSIKKLFAGESVLFTGKLYSSEHDQSFSVQDAKLQIFKEKNPPDKYRLSLNGQNILDWFKQKYQEVKQTAGYYRRPSIKPEDGKSKGIKR